MAKIQNTKTPNVPRITNNSTTTYLKNPDTSSFKTNASETTRLNNVKVTGGPKRQVVRSYAGKSISDNVRGTLSGGGVMSKQVYKNGVLKRTRTKTLSANQVNSQAMKGKGSRARYVR